jgi:hypothetical protein
LESSCGGGDWLYLHGTWDMDGPFSERSSIVCA